MTLEWAQQFLQSYPTLAPWALGAAAVVLSVLVFLIVRYVIARGLSYLAQRTESKYDDIVVARLHPYRFAWIAPLLVIYWFADVVPAAATVIRQIVLFLILWLVVVTVNSLLNAASEIFEASKYYRGEPIQGYLDLVKIILVLVALILSISLWTGQSPLALLTGLGAAMAVLLLVFRDTLLSFVASVQIQSNDLIKEGDWIEVPSYNADGQVLNMALHTVTVQNWDKSMSMIPTYKFMEVSYKNWRGMVESGARRMKRAVHIDLNSIRFCDDAMIERLKGIELLSEFLDAKLPEIEEWNRSRNATPENPIEGRQLTNIGAFQAYMTEYLRSRPDLHQEDMTVLAHQLAPGPMGLPLEVYGFVRTTDWSEYEATQADIVDHLLSALPIFGLRVFQQPTGLDFQAGLQSSGAASLP